MFRECTNHAYIAALLNMHTHNNTYYTCTHAGTNKAGDTPLSLACANGHLNTVKYLVNEHHCDPRGKALYGTSIAASLSTTPEHACTGTVNKAGDTLLSLAYKGGHWEVVKYLAITHHCDTTSKFQFMCS